MSDFLSVSALAVLQGVAEFLPISSSGHLVIGQHLLGLDEPGMRLDVFLHAGTLLSILVYFRARVLELLAGVFARGRAGAEARAYAAKLLLSALPAVAVYAVFHAEVKALFENAKMVGALLMFTGAVLFGTRLLPRGSREVGAWSALVMGAAQALALLPGVSRSGMTLAAARTAGVDAGKSAEFSFLMSAPLIAGGALLECLESFAPGGASPHALSWWAVLWGAAVAAAVGYLSLALLVKALKGKWFWAFGPYCFAAGLLTLWLC